MSSALQLLSKVFWQKNQQNALWDPISSFYGSDNFLWISWTVFFLSGTYIKCQSLVHKEKIKK